MVQLNVECVLGFNIYLEHMEQSTKYVLIFILNSVQNIFSKKFRQLGSLFRFKKSS